MKKIILFVLLNIGSICLFAQHGDTLFKANCAVCHTVGNGILVGPDLKGVGKKYTGAHLLKWIQSSQAVIKSGDTGARAIYKQFNNIVMPDQSLSDAEIKSIIAYIGTESIARVASADSLTGIPTQISAKITAVAGEPNSEKTANVNLDTLFTYGGVGLVIIFLLIIVWVLATAVRSLSDALKK